MFPNLRGIFRLCFTSFFGGPIIEAMKWEFCHHFKKLAQCLKYVGMGIIINPHNYQEISDALDVVETIMNSEKINKT